jgi:hypothetical protein
MAIAGDEAESPGQDISSSSSGAYDRVQERIRDDFAQLRRTRIRMGGEGQILKYNGRRSTSLQYNDRNEHAISGRMNNEDTMFVK